MGLDKWLNSEEVEKQKKKKPTEFKKKKNQGEQAPESKTNILNLMKYTLNCPNAKCKYQKTVMKKILTDLDKICPRCNNELKVKSI